MDSASAWITALERAFEIRAADGQVRTAALASAFRLWEAHHLDDAMLRVVTDETTPRSTSLLFCAAIGTCQVEPSPRLLA